jgi:hypothetical protein
MNQLWHRAAELLNNKTDPAIRQAQFQQLFHDDFDGLPGLDYSLVRAKKLPRAAECPVYSLTPSGVLAENHPKNRGFGGILHGQKCLRRGQKCLRRCFSRRSPVGEWPRGARSMPRVLARVATVSRPRSSATATMQLYFRRSGSSRDTVLQNQVERAA